MLTLSTSLYFISLLSTSSTSPTSRSYQYRYYIVLILSTSLSLSTFCLHRLHCRHRKVDYISTTSCRLRLHHNIYQLTVYIVDIAKLTISETTSCRLLSTLIYFSFFCLQRLHRRHREVDNIGTTSCRRCLHPYTYQLNVYIAKLIISVIQRVDFVYIPILINLLSTSTTSPTSRS